MAHLNCQLQPTSQAKFPSTIVCCPAEQQSICSDSSSSSSSFRCAWQSLLAMSIHIPFAQAAYRAVPVTFNSASTSLLPVMYMNDSTSLSAAAGVACQPGSVKCCTLPLQAVFPQGQRHLSLHRSPGCAAACPTSSCRRDDIGASATRRLEWHFTSGTSGKYSTDKWTGCSASCSRCTHRRHRSCQSWKEGSMSKEVPPPKAHRIASLRLSRSSIESAAARSSRMPSRRCTRCSSSCPAADTGSRHPQRLKHKQPAAAAANWQ